MSSVNTESKILTPIEEKLKELESAGAIQSEHGEDSTEEVIDYLMYMVRLARKKTQSRKLKDVVKIKWAKVAVDASKTLLFSGALNKRTKNQVTAYQALFMSVVKDEPQDNGSPYEEDRQAME